MLYSIPLNNRKYLAVWVENQTWIPNRHKHSISVIRDWAGSNSNEFHRYLWSHHLGIAKYYEENNDFSTRRLILTRKMLFEQLQDYLFASGQLTKVNSIFEVGCSSGYMLSYIEKNMFPEAEVLEGIDIDDYALDKGKAYLRAHSSKIRLIRADMIELDWVMNKKKYDLILCLGVLMYLEKEAASQVVKSIISHSNGVIAIADLAHPMVDNAKIGNSVVRAFDGAYMHNIDEMVQKSGGEIVCRRWEGSKTFDGQSVYFLFCRPKKPHPAEQQNNSN
jgi:SAM-dependent methyltransferase